MGSGLLYFFQLGKLTVLKPSSWVGYLSPVFLQVPSHPLLPPPLHYLKLVNPHRKASEDISLGSKFCKDFSFWNSWYKFKKSYILISSLSHKFKASLCAFCRSVMSNCLWTPWTVAHQALLSMGFSRQEYWSELPCPPPGDLPDPGIKPTSLKSPTSAGRFFTASATSEAPKCPVFAVIFEECLLGSLFPSQKMLASYMGQPGIFPSLYIDVQEGGDVLKSIRWTSPRSWSRLRVSQIWYPLQDRLDGEFNWLTTRGRQRGFLYCKADLLKILKCLNKKSSEKIFSKLVCKCLRFLMAKFYEAPCQCYLFIQAVSRNRELTRDYSL